MVGPGHFRKGGRFALPGLEGWKIAASIPLSGFDPMLQSAEVKVNTSLNLETSLDGKLSALQRGDLTGANGDFSMTATNATIEAPLLKQLRFDKVQIEAHLEKSKLDVKSISLAGPDVTGTISGFVNVGPMFPRSSIDLDAKLTLTPKAQDLRALVGTLGAANNVKMTDDGRVVFKISGSFGSPQIRGY